MTEPKQLTEEMPETPQDLSSRGLILSSGEVTTDKVITEDLPEDEDVEAPQLLTED